jgi:GTP cyclohydrolase I
MRQNFTLQAVGKSVLQASTPTEKAPIQEQRFTEQDWRRLLISLGENPDGAGLVETPSRIAKAWKHWTSGYAKDPAECLNVFEDGAQGYNELIVVRGIPAYSHYEHHLALFFSSAAIGYVSNGKIVGLAKLTHLVDCFAHRLQVQERFTIQMVNALMTHLEPQAVGVVIRCRHLCIESRGIRTQGEETVSSSMLGTLQSDHALRAEFFAVEHAA